MAAVTIEVSPIELTADTILNKGINLYGGSGSGKSTVILHFMNILKDQVGQIIVISPSDPTNHTYSGTWGDGKGVVPLPLIHYTITDGLLKSIWERQEALSQIYKQADDLSVMERLFRRLNLVNVNRAIETAEAKKAQSITEIRKNTTNEVDAERECDVVRAKFDGFIKMIYRRNIIKYRDQLTLFDLDPGERHCLKYIDLNPRLLLIFDDCSSMLNGLNADSRKIMQEVYFRGRWVNITTINAVHDDKMLSLELRKNAHITICTNAQAATTFFGRPGSGFGTDMKRLVGRIVGTVFREGAFCKLLYMRSEEKLYLFTAAKQTVPFVFGNEAILAYCEKIASTDTITVDTNNRFYDYFRSTPR
jgi:hypothetical protein